MMKSQTVRAVLLDELERNGRLLARYRQEVDRLPKGSVYQRRIGGQCYLYLSYRENAKTISKFLGKVDVFDRSKIDADIEKRRSLVGLVRRLKQERRDIERGLR